MITSEKNAHYAKAHCDLCGAQVGAATRYYDERAQSAAKQDALDSGGAYTTGSYVKDRLLCGICTRQIVWAYHQREST